MTKSGDRPLIAITMGEPAGVGAEVIARALADPAIRDLCAPLVLGHTELLNRAARAQSLDLTFADAEAPTRALPPRAVPVLEGRAFDSSIVTPGWSFKNRSTSAPVRTGSRSFLWMLSASMIDASSVSSAVTTTQIGRAHV